MKFSNFLLGIFSKIKNCAIYLCCLVMNDFKLGPYFLSYTDTVIILLVDNLVILLLFCILGHIFWFQPGINVLTKSL